MPKKTRTRFSAPEIVAILRLHLLERSPISDLCDQHGIHPTMFYRWQISFSRMARLPSSHVAAAVTPRTAGSPCWSRSSNERTKSSPSSWRNISN